jgi:hypothetical protein
MVFGPAGDSQIRFTSLGLREARTFIRPPPHRGHQLTKPGVSVTLKLYVTVLGMLSDGGRRVGTHTKRVYERRALLSG